MIEPFAFVPIHHATLDGDYRTPVWVEPASYTVCVGDNAYRHYSHDTVPTRVKALVTMVNAFPYTPPNEPVHPMAAYVCKNLKQIDVGWRVDDLLYMLVLDEATLECMYITGDGHG